MGSQATFTYRVTNTGVPPAGHSRDVVYFVNNENAEGEELWQSDGTLGGTRLVKDDRLGLRLHGQGKLEACVHPR